MKFQLSPEQEEKQKKFSELASKIKQAQSEQLHQRLRDNPYPTIEESALGAFMEMYEPHILPVVRALLEKGYLIAPNSGFGKDHPDYQTLYGQFLFDEKIINSLKKIEVAVQKETNKRYMKFYPEKTTMESILSVYNQIIEILPARTGDIEISQTSQAKKFRRTYIPQNADLKQTRLFEILMYEVQEKVSEEIKTRLEMNKKPTLVELNLGVFIERIEPQVRDAVLEFNRKGYSTDVSGFKGISDMQWIDGDFSLDEMVRKKFEEEGVTVTTNQSGYTSIQFQPTEASFDGIHKKWMRLASFLPDKKIPSSPCMTAKAREFRKKYSQETNHKR